MADRYRHAAGQPVYEVRELIEGDPAVDLGVRYECTDFIRAIDYAVIRSAAAITNAPSRVCARNPDACSADSAAAQVTMSSAKSRRAWRSVSRSRSACTWAWRWSTSVADWQELFR